MTSATRARRLVHGLFACLALALAAAIGAQRLDAQARTGPRCLKCHGDREFISGVADPRQRDSSLFRPAGAIENSVHRSLQCGDCHRGQDDGYPHRAGVKVIPCESCHQEQGRDWAASVHASNAVTLRDAPTCVGCHGTHSIYASTDARSATYKLNVAATCGRCHSDPKIIGRYFNAPAKQEAAGATIHFPNSVHGIALSRAGLLVAATCSDCHRAHLILPADSARSSVSRTNMPHTCGLCHAGVVQLFDSSAHGVDGKRYGNTTTEPPVCADCHSAHGIVRADQPEWQLKTVEECGTCHKRVSETYYQTYHGKVTRLGGGTVATCSDCHTAHNVRGAGDPRSSVNRENLVATCAKCHASANENYVKYNAHGDYRDRGKYPVMYWTYMLMTTLLVSVWTFWAIHIVLWFIRLLIDRRKRKHGGGHGGEAPAGGAA